MVHRCKNVNVSMLILIILVNAATLVGCQDVDFYSFSALDLEENNVSFEKYRGKVTLIVNVASECGYTDDHYKSLNLLNRHFEETGKFNILAFPCNQFGGQEPGASYQIHDFAYKTMEATFPLFAKIDVIGDNAPASWKYLIDESGYSPTWNFWKYLVDHNGDVLGAWGPHVGPSQLKDLIQDAIDDISIDVGINSYSKDEF